MSILNNAKLMARSGFRKGSSMCGIAGIISPTRSNVIERMTKVLAHRGPDGAGYYHDDSIALGHRRLSIIDIQGGKQPISNETGSLQLVCNGEIYNSPQLRKQLTLAGHTFKTKTDVEVILHLYEEYGDDCVKHLRGMFAFAIWDQVEQTLFMARDHMGQKPLFFYQNDCEFIFASEIKALLATNVIKPEIELNALWHYISLRFIPDEYSLFREIKKLPAATLLKWRAGKVSTKKYWELDFIDKLSGSETEIEEGLHEILLDTIKIHMLSDVRVGAFLSGGIDSSTVAAMMAHVSGEPIPTFSIGVKEQGFNELPYARMVADKYGCESHEKVVQANLIHLIPSMIYHLDEPSDPFGVGVYLVSREAGKIVKVVLGGDGGDENFAGYDRFAGNSLVDYYCLLPRWFRVTVMQKVIERIPESFGYKSLAQKAAWVNQMSLFSGGERYAQSMSILRFTQQSKQRLFTDSAKAKIEDYDSLSKILKFFNSESVDHLVDRMLYTDLMTRMPDHLLAIVDRMCMAHSLESRSPLIDYKLVEYAASIPADLKLRGRNLKYILKKVASRYLPPELIHREKQGFGFPLALWMRKDLKEFLTNLFADSRFAQLGLFDSNYMHQLLDEHISGTADHNFRLWILINLEVWYRIYFDHESIDEIKDYINRISIQST
jgi:asparagine synthase (glutamine-hydrolysing)